ncbi:MAG: hypothetical protein ABIV13_07420 [Fimbriimonadales bacterium]
MSVVGALLAATAAFAQDDLAITPENRWVIDALSELQNKGLLVGYRPFAIVNDPHMAKTRYVLASATNAAYLKLTGLKVSIQSQIDSMYKRSASCVDLDLLRAELNDLKGQVEGFQTYDKNVWDLIKLSRYFYKDLHEQGIDFIAMRRDLEEMRVRYCSGYGSVAYAKSDPRLGAKYKPSK